MSNRKSARGTPMPGPLPGGREILINPGNAVRFTGEIDVGAAGPQFS